MIGALARPAKTRTPRRDRAGSRRCEEAIVSALTKGKTCSTARQSRPDALHARRTEPVPGVGERRAGSILDRELPRTECAIDAEDPGLVGHVAAIFLGESCQDLLEVLDRAAAPARKALRRMHPHFGFFVEQAPYQRLGRQARIDQFVVADRMPQDRDMIPFELLRPHMQA